MQQTVQLSKNEHEEPKEYAGFWRRAGANLLDGLIVSLPVGVILGLILTGELFPQSTIENPVTLHQVLTDLIFALYGLILPVVWVGFTLGKKIMNVKIQRVDGRKLGIGTMLMRNVVASFAYVFSFGILLIVSAVMVGVREDKRSVHDFIAGTEVVKTKD